MKLKVLAKYFVAGLIIIGFLALILAFTIDAPDSNTRGEMVGTLVGIYQPQVRNHVGIDRFLVQLNTGQIVQARTAEGVIFRKGKKAIVFEYTTTVLRRKVYIFDRYLDDNKSES